MRGQQCQYGQASAPAAKRYVKSRVDREKALEKAAPLFSRAIVLDSSAGLGLFYHSTVRVKLPDASHQGRGELQRDRWRQKTLTAFGQQYRIGRCAALLNQVL